MFVLDRIAEDLAGVVAGLEPARLAGSDAARLTATAARIEKLAATAKAALATRAEETHAWRGGRAASPEQWLAETSGCSEGAAREALVTAKRVETLPATRERLLDGTLSMAQAALVSAGAAVDPGSERRLLKTASRSGMRGLRAEKERVVAAVADLLETLAPLTQQRFEAARKDERRESHDAYRFDALCDLARTGSRTTAQPPKHTARVRVDLPALLRGHTEAGETCEIPGVGPVPVSHAREVLSNGLLQLVITDGVDVQTVVSTTRHVPTPLKIAIAERDQRCKIRGCDTSTNLHRHHTTPVADGGLTTYQMLGNLCPRHHHLVHDDGYDIVDHADGTWDLRAPAARAGRAPPGQAAA